MKKIIVILLLSLSYVFPNSLNLTQNDIVILTRLRFAYHRHLMKYSLMAIAIKESSLGKYVINSKSEDYGLFQANIKTVLSRQKVKDNSYNRSIYAQKLINDVGFATANAIIELKYWRKVHKDNWFKTWTSYNTGWNYNSNTGIKYATKVFDIIKKLKLEYKL